MQALHKVLTALTLAGLLFGFGTSASAAPKTTITATPSSLTFSAKLGAGAPAAQVVSIGNTSTRFNVSADQSWIVFPANNMDRNLRVSVNIAGLAAGTYTGHALLGGAHIANSPLSIPITLVISPAVTATAPAITGQPSNQTVNVTQAGTFSVAASGTAPLTYQWSKNGAAVSGATSAAYTTPATLNTDNGTSFSVTVHNTAGTATSSSAILTVTPAAIAPAITTQPVSQTVNAGQTATFSVVATGTAPLVYQWTKNGAAVFGASSATYTIPATVAADTLSTFAVTVHNAAGNATSSSATLTVASSAVTINAAPASFSFALTLGGTAPAQQSVTINSTSPSVALAFSLSADQTWIKLEMTSGTAPVTTKLSVASGNLAAGTYNGHVIITSAGATNSPLSVPVTLVISPAATAPAITGQPTNQTVNVTQAGTFSVAASGTAPLTYQWSKNGAAVSGATSATYTTPATSNTDNGASFTVTVGNTAGTATSNSAILTVTPAAIAPAITTQPVSQTVNAGQTATFSVAASGTAPFTYQWAKNGTAVSGATSATYITPMTVPADTLSNFAVTVHNAAGNATSSSATLTVASSAVTINAAPASFSFALTLGGTAPAQQSVTINSSSPSAPQAFSLSADQTWIKLDITSGTTPATTKISVATGSLAAGTYNGHVVITAAGVTNSPLSVPVTLVISPTPAPEPTTTTLAVSTGTPSYGAIVTFTSLVTGSSPTGTVTFVGNIYNTLGTCTLSSGTCTFSLSNLIPGTQSIVAAYGGDSSNAASNSSLARISVGSRSLIPTTTTLSVSPEVGVYGANVMLTAAVSPILATGNVTFKNGSIVIGTASLTPSTGNGVSTSLFGFSVGTPYVTPALNYYTVRSWDNEQDLSWAANNPSNGTYNWANLDSWVANNAGKDMIYDLARTPQWASLYPLNTGYYGPGQCAAPSSLAYWDNYLTAVATRYPQIKYWEVWNEPQYPGEYCDSTSGSYGPISMMATLSQHASTIIKQLIPSAIILSPATDDWYTGGLGAAWMTKFLTAGGTFDIFAFHGYINNPGMAEDEVTIVKNVQAVIKASDILMPMWDTEAGWYTRSQPVLATTRQPGFLVKMYLIQQSLGVARFVWYQYQAYPEWGQMYNTSTGDNANVPAYNAAYNWLTGVTLSMPCSVNANVETCGYTRPGGYVAQAVWETNSTDSFYIYTYPAGMTQYLDVTGAQHLLSGGTVTIGDAPILLENESIPGYSAVLSTGTLPIGTNSITAVYSGDVYNATSVSPPTP